MLLFLGLHNQMRHFTLKPFICELQGVFSVSGPALNCKAQAQVRLVEVGEHKDKLLNETFLFLWVGFLCLAGVCVLGSSRGGRREEVRTTWKEEGRPSYSLAWFTPSTNVPHFLLFHSLSPSLASLFLCPSFPLGRQPCALEALRDETTDWSFSRGQKKEKAPEKAWLALQPRHQPATKLDVVKLSNYLRKLQQNLRRQKGRKDFFFCPILLQKIWYL